MAASAKVWSLDQMLRMLEKGTMTYSNIYQRSYVWDRETECNLIASYIEGRDIPAITANRHVDGEDKGKTLFDLLNGKQRLTASGLFKNNQFPISNLRKLKLNPEDAVELTEEEKERLHYYVGEKGEEAGREIIDINGMYFKDLPEILQRVILGRMIRIEYHDNMSREDERQTIINANSGKGMTTAEKLRVEMVSFEQVIELAKHPLFLTALSEKAIAGYWNEKIAEQMYCMLYMDEPALDNKSFRSFIRSAIFTEEQVDEITKILDRFMAVFEIVDANDKIKYAKARILGKVHIISFAKVMKRSIDEDVPVEKMALWMEYFFSGKKRASISNTYNEWANRNTNQKKSIETRLAEVNASYEKYIVSGEDIPVVEKIAPTQKNKKEEVIRTVVTDASEETQDTDIEDHADENALNIGAENSFPELKDSENDEKKAKQEVVRTVVEGDIDSSETNESVEGSDNNSEENTSEGTQAEQVDSEEEDEELTEEKELERELLEEKRMEEEFLKGLSENSSAESIIMLDDEDDEFESRETFFDPA